MLDLKPPRHIPTLRQADLPRRGDVYRNAATSKDRPHDAEQHAMGYDGHRRALGLRRSRQYASRHVRPITQGIGLEHVPCPEAGFVSDRVRATPRIHLAAQRDIFPRTPA